MLCSVSSPDDAGAAQLTWGELLAQKPKESTDPHICVNVLAYQWLQRGLKLRPKRHAGRSATSKPSLVSVNAAWWVRELELSASLHLH